jgi:hypothetical protein
MTAGLFQAGRKLHAQDNLEVLVQRKHDLRADDCAPSASSTHRPAWRSLPPLWRLDDLCQFSRRRISDLLGYQRDSSRTLFLGNDFDLHTSTATGRRIESDGFGLLNFPLLDVTTVPFVQSHAACRAHFDLVSGALTDFARPRRHLRLLAREAAVRFACINHVSPAQGCLIFSAEGPPT